MARVPTRPLVKLALVMTLHDVPPFSRHDAFNDSPLPSVDDYLSASFLITPLFDPLDAFAIGFSVLFEIPFFVMIPSNNVSLAYIYRIGRNE